jgi:hypothetical protein
VLEKVNGQQALDGNSHVTTAGTAARAPEPKASDGSGGAGRRRWFYLA